MTSVKKEIGNLGEDFAEGYFVRKGYRVTRNYHSRYGEIDLIAENEERIIFVEVKTRRDGSMTEPKDSVDIFKQRKIIATAKHYLMKNETEKQMSFDVFEVLQHNGRIFKFNHIEAAFDAEGAE